MPIRVIGAAHYLCGVGPKYLPKSATTYGRRVPEHRIGQLRYGRDFVIELIALPTVDDLTDEVSVHCP